MKKYLAWAAILALTFTIACSILKKSDPEKEVRDFLTVFQQSLSQSDDLILKQFDVSQSKQSVLTAIAVLQNKANTYITCDADFPNAAIIKEEDFYKVDVPVVFKAKGLEEATEYEKKGFLTLRIKARGNDLIIAQFDGEQFYETFASVKSDLQWSAQRKDELVARDTIYAMAAKIQQKYDSVIWYAKYDGHYFFYVVEGTWDNYFRRWKEKPGETHHKMGVVDMEGNVVVPVEYDLVGTIGFDFPMVVEVTKAGKVGYFDVKTRKEIVAATHDILFPYAEDGIFCLTKTDSSYGWYDNQMTYQQGFNSKDAEEWIRSFSFIPGNLQFNDSAFSLCEIPRGDDAGYGIIMPPSYLVKSGIFNPIIGGISTTEVPLNGWTEYVQTEGTSLKGITGTLSALITRIKERYIDGREEFYTHDKLVFFNQSMDTVSTANLNSSGDISIRRIGEDLIEVAFESNDYMMAEEELEEVVPSYQFFKMSAETSIELLRSDRLFEQTEFVSLDSSYITGPFRFYNSEIGKMDEREMLSAKTLKLMRDEILAIYHFSFPDDPEALAYFKTKEWYQGEFTSHDEFVEDMSATDKYNLNFLEKMIALMEAPQPI